MEVQEAIPIVRALADGVNPETKEPCANDSVYRNPSVVKALNRAVGALVAQQERDRNKPISSGKYWTHAEDEQVCQELRKGLDFHQIAKNHNRTVGSIAARLIKLGKVSAGSPGKLSPSDGPPKNRPSSPPSTVKLNSNSQAG